MLLALNDGRLTVLLDNEVDAVIALHSGYLDEVAKLAATRPCPLLELVWRKGLQFHKGLAAALRA